ncbi:MAG TPA: MHYT domain-containing protein [Stellaceae bacterium]|jgi:NO-binding membrane sensor protein with MHYT domain/anti-sigma regulatory factor (Ser/Thr protein kinase)
MLQLLYACIVEQHDLRLVGLAAFVCLFACFTATNLLAGAQGSSGKRRDLWHAAAALVFGVGVWTTHFIAELAYRPGIPVGYDIELTILSIAVAVVLSWIGMWIVLSLRVRHIGGAVVGLAVGAMHYIGVAALRAPADLIWDPVMVAISVVTGAAMAAAAMEVLSPKPRLGNLVGATVLLVLAIVGLHFIGMAALTLRLDPAIDMPREMLAPELLAIAVAAGTALIITLGLAGAFVDNRLAQRAIEENERLQRRIEERTAELRQVQDELVRNERLSVLGQLTATIAHELRNPLSAIGNTIYAVRQRVEMQGLDLDRPLGRIERSVSRCERIINDLIDFTQMRAIEPKPVAINAWLAALLDALQVDVRIERRFSARDPIVDIDRERMRRVIVNLLENAVHAMSEPLPDNRQPCIAIGARSQGGRVEITVEDNGRGIPADVLPKVFEPLFSTKSFGTGLGLPTVKQIIEQHAGTIAITTSSATGTRVTLRLPIAQAKEMAA